jgi:hypothetical protein
MVASIEFSEIRDNLERHCEHSAAIHVFGAQRWIATACGLAMTKKCLSQNKKPGRLRAFSWVRPVWAHNCV